MKSLALTLVAMAVVACANVVPTPTPGSYENFVAGLVQRGATVTQQVAGDAGCVGSDLHSNAARFDVTFGQEQRQYSVYLFTWRRQSDYDAAGGAFDRCVHAAEQANPLTSFTILTSPPLRVYGGDWSPALTDAIELSLGEASGR